MNLRHVRFILSVVSEGTFSAAARLCHVSQPTLSSGIDQIEKELGASIFDRTTRRVDLTSFGQHILPFLEDMIRARDAVDLQSKAYFDPETKIARIGTSPQLQSTIIAERLSVLDGENIEYCFKQCFLDDLHNRLETDQIDFSIEPSASHLLENDRYVQVPFGQEALLFLPADTDQSSPPPGDPIDLWDLESKTIALTQNTCGLANHIRQLFQKAEIGLIEYRGKATNYQTLEDWAALGIAHTILPQSCISEKSINRAHPITFDGKLLTIEYILRRRRTSALLPHLQKVEAALKKT